MPEVTPFFIKAGLVDEKWLETNAAYFEKLIDVVRVRVKTLQEVVDASTYFFKDLTEYDEKGIAKHFKPEAVEILSECLNGLEALDDFSLENTEKLYNDIAKRTGLALGKVIHPTRLALTGRTVSPGLFDVMLLLGKEKTIKRIKDAIIFINSL